MQKKLMAVAVAGALAAPGVALAQTSTVQIGGSLHAFYYFATPHNASAARKAENLESSEPEMFVRGEEQLGRGLSAWFQCTSSLDGIITGANTITNSGWCARNSGIGFKGGFGNVFWGNWDDPHKLVTNRIRGWFGGTNSFTGGVGTVLLGGAASGTQNPSTTVTAGTAATTLAATLAAATVGFVTIPATAASGTTTLNNPASFFRRQASSVTYHSPSWGGFQFQGMFTATNEFLAPGVPESSSIKPRMWSLAAHYDNGPLYLGAAYERHRDFNASNQSVGPTGYTGTSDHNWLIGAGYTFAGVAKVTGLYSSTKYEPTATTDLKVRGFAVYLDWAIAGPHSLKAQYVNQRDIKGTATRTVGAYRAPGAATCASLPGSSGSCGTDTGAQQFSLFYAYNFSKRTLVYGGGTRVKNDTNSIMSLGKVAPTAGASQTHLGIGMQHRF